MSMTVGRQRLLLVIALDSSAQRCGELDSDCFRAIRVVPLDHYLPRRQEKLADSPDSA